MRKDKNSRSTYLELLSALENKFHKFIHYPYITYLEGQQTFPFNPGTHFPLYSARAILSSA